MTEVSTKVVEEIIAEGKMYPRGERLLRLLADHAAPKSDMTEEREGEIIRYFSSILESVESFGTHVREGCGRTDGALIERMMAKPPTGISKIEGFALVFGGLTTRVDSMKLSEILDIPLASAESLVQIALEIASQLFLEKSSALTRGEEDD